MIGKKLSHYTVIAKLGEGGMGEVYRAEDTKLGREVAIKVLPAEMASSPERLERFQREAKALAALDHPGIVTVYSVEESDDVHFLTMQLVEGEPLDRLIPEKGLDVDRVLEIGTAIAEAVSPMTGLGFGWPGDLLITSGLGGRFPPGYPVATVQGVRHDPGQSFSQVVATPMAELNRSREVLLVWPGISTTLEPAVPADAANTPSIDVVTPDETTGSGAEPPVDASAAAEPETP